MTGYFRRLENVAGILLALPFLVSVALLLLLAVGPGLDVAYGGPHDIAARPALHRWSLTVANAGMVIELLGMTLLTLLLREAGDRALSALSLVLFAVTGVFWLIEMTLRMSVGVWAAQQIVRMGSEPEAWTALHLWIYPVRLTHVILGLLAIAGYGGAILHTDLLPRWVGWASIAWSGVWLLAVFVTGVAIPAVLLIMPLVIGVALLVT